MEQVSVFCEAWGGFGDLHGVLQFDGESVVLRFQTADAFIGLVRSEAKRLVFPLGEVGEVRYQAGWFWLMPAIELSLSDFEALAQLPIKNEGRLRLRVRFADRRQAARLVDSLAQAAANHRFRRLDDELARMTRPQGLPPPAPMASPSSAPPAPQSGSQPPAAEREPPVRE
jgi:hypothetical protein